jgi:hypothetical protein
MSAAKPKYWNLAQSVAWVIFRVPKAVNLFGGPEAPDWRAFMKYPSSWSIAKDFEKPELLTANIPSEDVERIERRAAIYDSMQIDAKERIEEFKDALRTGRITAHGWINSKAPTTRPIPTVEWQSLILDPPQAYRLTSDGQKVYPWHDIQFERDAVLTVWLGDTSAFPAKITSPRKDWITVDKLLGEFSNDSIGLGMSDRTLSERVRRRMKNVIDKKRIPGDRALRDHISKRRKAGTLPPRKRD